jgi:hypothetical protein
MTRERHDDGDLHACGDQEAQDGSREHAPAGVKTQQTEGLIKSGAEILTAQKISPSKSPFALPSPFRYLATRNGLLLPGWTCFAKNGLIGTLDAFTNPAR